jgi:hypothetical protein
MVMLLAAALCFVNSPSGDNLLQAAAKRTPGTAYIVVIKGNPPTVYLAIEVHIAAKD